MADSGVRDRDRSLDILRGVLIVLMAIDHVRIFFSAAQFDPLAVDQTTAGWYFTRWITHVCAPGFFAVAGIGVALMARHMERAEIVRFLLIRGLWLIALEILVLGLAWSFTPGWTWLGVIWGLGAAMILLAGFVYLPRELVLVVAAAFTFLHDLLPAGEGGLWMLFVSGGFGELPILGREIVLYPVLPWAALMALGYAAGPWLMPEGVPSARRCIMAGAALLAVFLLARLVGFGQPAEGGFAVGAESVQTVLSFLNVAKYPPSLQFSLVTLGLTLLLFGLFATGRSAGWFGSFLETFGRVPFFFYVLHLFLIHGLALATAKLLDWPTDYLFWTPPFPNLAPPDGYGFGLPGIYLMWAVVVLLLYPLCLWFAARKKASAAWWMRLL